MFSKFKTSTVNLGGLGIIIITFCVLQYVVARSVEKRSFECRCGIAKIGAADEIRRKRQTVHSKLETLRLKRDTFHQIKTLGKQINKSLLDTTNTVNIKPDVKNDRSMPINLYGVLKWPPSISKEMQREEGCYLFLFQYIKCMSYPA